MLDSTKWRMVILAENGFSARLIQENVRKYEGEQFSRSHIYKTLRSEGVRIKDYRDGKTRESKRVISDIGCGPQKRKKAG